MPAVASDEKRSLFDDLRRAVEIDKNDLDTCLVEQPDLFYRVSEAYTLARSLQDEIKYDIAQLEGTLGAQFREEAGEKKTTVDQIRQQIMSSPKMADLQKELLNASIKVGKWAALKEAYDMRASAMKSLTQLYASNYFTVATGSKPREEAQGRLNEGVRAEAGAERRNREPRLRPSRDAD